VDVFGGSESKLNVRERAMLARRLAFLLKAGVPLVQAVHILEEQADNARAALLTRVRRDIRRGARFSEALGAHPDAFDDSFVEVVRAGEAGGVTHERRARIRSAMLYPAFLVATALAAVVFLWTFVLPTFTSLYADMGMPLPLPTRLLVEGGEILVSRWYVFFGLPLVGWLGVRWFYASPVGRRRVDGWLLTLPVVGELVVQTMTARFARVLATLIDSGVNRLEALKVVRGTISNRAVAESLREAAERVREGGTVSESLDGSEVFEPMVVKMMAVGERSGELGEMLHWIARLYERRVEDRVEGLTALVEPVLVVSVGLTVGLVLLALYLPMFRLARVIG